MKLTSSVGLVVGILNLQAQDIYTELIILISELLSHKYPKVRKLMADKFYLYLLANGEEKFGDE